MKSFEHELANASAEWVREGLLEAAQRERILARHPAPPAGANPWTGRFVAVLATLGCVCLAVGIILLVSANWEDIGDWTKIGVMLALLVGGYGAGWRLKVSPGRYPLVGDAVLMLSGLVFLSGIALVSQIFHLNARPATGVLVWAIGIAPVPWLTRSKGALFLSLTAWLIWLGYEFATVGSPLQLVLADGYDDNRIFTWASTYGLFGLALLLAGIGLRGGGWRDFSGTFTTPGLLLTCFCLYALGFYRHAYGGGRQIEEPITGNPLCFGLAAGLLVIAGIMACRRSRADTAALAPWLAGALVPIAGILFELDLGDGGWLWSVLAWAMLFVLNLGMVRAGLREHRPLWLNVALAFIGLTILSCYFDWFGTMLQGGVFFLVTGAVILGLGVFLEKQRRVLLARLHHPLPA